MVKKETVRTDDYSMNYFSFGSGKRTLVIVPGLTVKSIMNAATEVEAAFTLMHADFTVYVFDRRNELPPKYSVYDMASDTARVIEQLGLKDIFLYGASQGGMIAMTIAIEHPELIKKLALASTSSHVTREQYDALNKWIRAAENGDRAGLYLSYGGMIYPPDVFEQFRDYFLDISRSVTDEELRRFIIIASGAKDFNVTDRLKEIQCPVLTTGSFEDMVLDSDATMEIAEELDYKKDFHLYMYTGFGHASFDTAPDYRKRLYDFFMQ